MLFRTYGGFGPLCWSTSYVKRIINVYRYVFITSWLYIRYCNENKRIEIGYHSRDVYICKYVNSNWTVIMNAIAQTTFKVRMKIKENANLLYFSDFFVLCFFVLNCFGRGSKKSVAFDNLFVQAKRFILSVQHNAFYKI